MDPYHPSSAVWKIWFSYPSKNQWERETDMIIHLTLNSYWSWHLSIQQKANRWILADGGAWRNNETSSTTPLCSWNMLLFPLPSLLTPAPFSSATPYASFLCLHMSYTWLKKKKRIREKHNLTCCGPTQSILSPPVNSAFFSPWSIEMASPGNQHCQESHQRAHPAFRCRVTAHPPFLKTTCSPAFRNAIHFLFSSIPMSWHTSTSSTTRYKLSDLTSSFPLCFAHSLPFPAQLNFLNIPLQKENQQTVKLQHFN